MPIDDHTPDSAATAPAPSTTRAAHPLAAVAVILLVGFRIVLATGALAQSGDCLHATIPIDAINRSNQKQIQSVSNIREEQLVVEAGGHKARVVSLKPLRTGRVILVLDKSGSMSDKWDRVLAATLDLATRLPQTVGLGILVFSDKIEEFVPLTNRAIALFSICVHRPKLTQEDKRDCGTALSKP